MNARLYKYSASFHWQVMDWILSLALLFLTDLPEGPFLLAYQVFREGTACYDVFMQYLFVLL